MDNTNRNENNTLPVFTLMSQARISNTLRIFILSGHARHFHIITKFAKYAKQELLKYAILVAEGESKIEYRTVESNILTS